MKFKQNSLEICILVLIVYSIVVQFFELEFNDTDFSTDFFVWSERIVTAVFTIEYFVRWIASRKLSYPLSPMAIVDLLAILPFYLSFLVDLRSLRLLRGFRVLRLFKLYRYTDAVKGIQNAFSQVRYEFGIIGFAVLTLGWICAVAVYELEKNAQPQVFSKLTDAIWYTVTTLTTVGYGDKVPVTLGGRLVAIFMMVCGLGLFGTFVSLIGSAFLEELRKHPRRTHKKAHPVAITGLSDLSDSPDRYDPAQILHAMSTGTLNTEDAAGRAKTSRLLVVACQLLIQSHESHALRHSVSDAADPVE
jgi:voltage-gated potassium channel